MNVFRVDDYVMHFKYHQDRANFLYVHKVYDRERVHFYYRSKPNTRGRKDRGVVSTLVVVYISFVVYPRVLVSVPMNVSGQIVLSIYGGVHRVLFQRVVDPGTLNRGQNFRGENRSGYPTRAMKLLVLCKDSVSLVHYVVVKQVNHDSSRQCLVRVVSSLRNNKVENRVVGKYRLFLLLFLHGQATLSVFSTKLAAI